MSNYAPSDSDDDDHPLAIHSGRHCIGAKADLHLLFLFLIIYIIIDTYENYEYLPCP